MARRTGVSGVVTLMLRVLGGSRGPILEELIDIDPPVQPARPAVRHAVVRFGWVEYQRAGGGVEDAQLVGSRVLAALPAVGGLPHIAGRVDDESDVREAED